MEERLTCPSCQHPNKKFYVNHAERKCHCFHCGYSDYRKEFSRRLPSSHKKPHSEAGIPKREWSLPASYNTEPWTWPAEAQAWPAKYGIVESELTKHSIGYSEGRVWTPVWDSKGLAHLQGRDVFGTSDIKYITKKNRPAPFYIHHNDVMIITEDVLSAIKAGRLCSAMALQGTNLGDVYMSKLLELQPKKILLCLDNDLSTVKKKQRDIKKSLDLFFDCVIVRLNKDLKEYTSNEILNIIKRYPVNSGMLQGQSSKRGMV